MFIPRNVKTRKTNTLDPRHVPDIVSARLDSPACEVLGAAEELTLATRIVTQRAALWAALATFAASLRCAMSSACVAWATANDTDDEALLALTTCARSIGGEYGGAEVAVRAANLKRSKERLAEHNLRLVVHCARRQGLATGFIMPMSDMISEGALGLMKAVARFDPARGFRFSTMASWWIAHHVSRAIADQARTIRIPVHMVEGKIKVTQPAAALPLGVIRERPPPTSSSHPARPRAPSLRAVLRLARTFTVQQFLARENFANRFSRGDAIWVHEFFYALMQGYDAVAQATDVQIGGTDQLFNLMAGRKLMEAHGQRPQVVLTFRILEGTDGVQRMSKSLGNSICIDEPPGVIFTKVLNLPDNVMRNYAELVTRWEQPDIDALFAQATAGQLELRELKHKLAWEIVSIFQGDAAADQAAEDARRMFEGQAPSDAPVLTLAAPANILDVLLEGGVVKSKGEARRLVEQSGVRLDGVIVESKELMLEPSAGEQVIQAGKRKFLRVVAAV